MLDTIPSTGPLRQAILEGWSSREQELERRMVQQRARLVRDDTIGHFDRSRAHLLYDLRRFA